MPVKPGSPVPMGTVHSVPLLQLNAVTSVTMSQQESHRLAGAFLPAWLLRGATGMPTLDSDTLLTH